MQRARVSCLKVKKSKGTFIFDDDFMFCKACLYRLNRLMHDLNNVKKMKKA